MKVTVAETAGFCKGVKHALELTLEAVRKRDDGRPICTFGPLIHNRQVLSMLEDKRVSEVHKVEECAGKQVIIRAHGIPPKRREALHQVGAVILDATCRRVAKVQSAIRRFAKQGYHTVIVGDQDHAEVQGLLGYTGGRGVVIHDAHQVDELPAEWQKVLLVAQTTQNEEIFEAIRKRFQERYPEGVVKNTICGATHERQAEVRSLCSQVDAMVIVGGRHSGNTIRLAEVARECGTPTYHVETEDELDPREMTRYHSVGVSAGASTPNWIIRKVVRHLESIEPESHSRRGQMKKILCLLTYGNVYVALGAALLASVVEALTKLPISAGKTAMAASYLFAMHTLNHYLDQDAIRLNDPERAAFYQERQGVFKAVSFIAILASLGLAAGQGSITFLAMAAMVLLGLLYGVPLFPRHWSASILKIKDIPASRTFLIPVAWATVIAVLPYLTRFENHAGAVLFGFWVIFLLVLVRTTLLDLLDVQGDRLGGKETMVVLLGETRTARFILAVLILLILSVAAGALAGFTTTFAAVLLTAVAAYVWCLATCYKNRLKGGPLYETLIESILIGTGALALLWNHFVA